ncbi:zinc-finger domain-containing protein [Bacillus cereus group sp. BfR-BA-01360]|uniref:zinc-finger domain-containing protein n=1 Tax=Bacillus cereus group sp. BfR-BA-01360 TaxID=2920321 RepID=UPI001F597762|nr:zinc-finger domain-containing protein [Bacillus cereus group sp. BfR-BA-01360]
MDKKEIRIKILNLQDEHCANCKQHANTKYCLTVCEIGKRINKLGTHIGGTYAVDAPKRRTKEEWDKLCVMALSMREEGLTYAEIARKIGVNSGGYVIEQLQKRNLK